jgi:Flp pilus assembly protein TadG
MTLLRPVRRSQRATAAVEFALVAPVLLLLLGGLLEFGWAVWSDSALCNAVSQASYHAFLTGSGVSPSSIATMTEQASALRGVTATASPAACYCASGTPATPTPAASCTTTCADGTTPGTYTTIVAQYTVPAFMPLFASPTITETAIVRLK